MKITSKVVDYDTDRPIPGVTVQAVSSSGNIFASASTGADGVFILDSEGLDNPYAKVLFSKQGYASESMQPQSANNTEVVLAKSDTLPGFTVIFKNNKMKILLFAALAAVAVFLFMKYRNQIKL